MTQEEPVLRWGPPQLIYDTQQEFLETGARCPNSNFLKAAKWAPDGSCLLATSEDKLLRVFDLPRDVLERPPLSDDGGGGGGGDHAARTSAAGPPPPKQQRGQTDDMRPALAVHAGEAVYDAAWFPGMNAADPASCCFASTSRGHPIQVWDACTGELRASYAAYDAADAPITAYALAFSPDGARVLGGYAKGFRVFDVARPGRGGCIASVETGRRRRGKAATGTSSSGGVSGVSGLAGIISCLAFNAPACDLLAAGSYSGDAAVFDARTLAQELLLQGHTGGVTQVMFGRDGNYLYTGARRDAAMHCWDVRMSAAAVYTLQRDARGTNQRLAFDIDPTGRHLATGSCDGAVRAYDLRSGAEVARFKAAPDAVVAAAFHPVMGLPLLATASGERRYPLAPPLASSSSSDSGSSSGDDNNVSSASEDGGVHARTSSRCNAAGQLDWLHSPRGANALRLWRLRLDWVEEGGGGGGGGAGAGSAAAAL